MTERDPAEPYNDLLYRLLPAAFRQGDVETNGQLRAAMAVLGTQYQALEANLTALYEDAFIETCADWIVPYIGAFVGVEGLDDPDLALPEQRALVGNAIAYRRRKGVATVLQPLVRAASGWFARVDEPSPGAPQTLVEMSVWRLPVFAMTGATPASLPSKAGQIASDRYAFQPLGLALQLFNQPGPPPPATRASPPAALPLALTSTIMRSDLDRYWRGFGRLAPAARPPNSELYGPDRGLAITLDGTDVAPAQILVMDLTDDDIPPAAFPVFLSGPLTAIPPLPPKPLVAVTFGALGPYTIALQGSLGTLPEIAAALENALRSAGPSLAARPDPVFADAVVTVIGDQLVVVPGNLAPAVVTFTAAAHDPTTAPALGLTSPPATTLACARSGLLDPFPDVPTGVPLLLTVAINGSSPMVAVLSGPILNTIQLAAALQAAIRSSSAGPAFADAVVLASASRLLVIPGAAPVPQGGAGVVIAGFGGGLDLARLFGLDDRVGLDVEHGLFAFPPQEALPQPVVVSYGYAFGAALAGGPYERPAPAGLSQAMVIRVAADAALTTIGQALALWQKLKPPQAIVLIGDNGVYDLDPDTAIALAAGQSLVIAADAQTRPVLVAANSIAVSNAGANAATFVLEGVLLCGLIEIGPGPLSIAISDCTLYPPAPSRATKIPPDVSIIASEPIPGSDITVRRSLTGALVVPGEQVSIRAEDSVVGGLRPSNVVPLAVAGTLGHPWPPSPGPALTVQRTTMLGQVFVTALPLARDTLFAQAVFVADVTVGQVEYSYVPPDSTTPPLYRSQPLLALEQAAAELDLPSWHDLPPADAAAIRAEMAPRFVAAAYPSGNFARLADANAPEITQGGSAGGEMGAYAMARSAQRFALLQRVIRAGLPVGCDAHFTFMT